MRKKNSFWRLFTYMKGMLPAYIIGIVAVSLISAGTQVIMAYFFKNIYNAVLEKNVDFIIRNFLNFGLIIIVLHISLPFFTYLIDAIAAKTTGNLRKAVFHHAKQLPVHFFENRHSGDLISRLTNDIAEAEKAYSQTFIQFIVQVTTGVFTLAYMIYLEWRLALLVVFGAIVTIVINVYFAKKLKDISVNVQTFLAIVTERLSNFLAGIDVIRSFNLQNIYMEKYKVDNQRVYDISYKRINMKAIVSMLNTLVATMGFVGIVAIGTLLTIKGSMEAGIIIAALQLQAGPIQLVRALGNFIPELQSSLASAERLYEILDEKSEPQSHQMHQMNDARKQMDQVIAFQNVDFSYENDKVLNNISFEVAKGKVTALVGQSGSGKSTTFKLILNFYPIDNGEIFIKGDEVGKQTTSQIRSMMAYVPQDAYLFSGTIADNINYGNDKGTMKDIIQAAKVANAHSFIMKLENGYDTMVGERGAHLSGGQRQRIAIARAVLKDAPILLLDEATSALDTESEYLVQEALNRLMVGRTTLVIAHRLSTIQDADQILVFDKGQIVERGTHDELVGKKDGMYYNLYFEKVERDNQVAVS